VQEERTNLTVIYFIDLSGKYNAYTLQAAAEHWLNILKAKEMSNKILFDFSNISQRFQPYQAPTLYQFFALSQASLHKMLDLVPFPPTFKPTCLF
jgi:hypothetical protein